MFNFSKKDFEDVKKDLLKDVGDDLLEVLKTEYVLTGMETHGHPYDEAKLEHNEKEHVVGSEDFAPAIVDMGWDHGKLPNMTRIMEWVKNVKDGGANARLPENEIKQIAFKVAYKIQDEGIKPTWFARRALTKFTRESAI